MFSTSELLTGLYPAYQTYQMFKNVTYRIPEHEIGPVYEEVIIPEEDAMRLKWNLMGVRRDVRVFLTDEPLDASNTIRGSHFSDYSDVAIFLNRATWQHLPNFREFALLSRVSRLKADSQFKECVMAQMTYNIVYLMTHIAYKWLFKEQIPSWPKLVFPTLIAEYAKALFYSYHIDRADVEAIQNIITPVAGLAQPLAVYVALRELRIADRQMGIIERFAYTETGEVRFDPYQPSLSHRILRLQAAIALQQAALLPVEQ